MKKYFISIFLISLLFISITSAQITGDGSYGSPYTGTGSNQTFIISDYSTVYFYQLIISSGTNFTIGKGVKFLAKFIDSSISITGSGIFTADGGPDSDMILFSADWDGDGIPGATDTWTHFLINTTSSVPFDHCIIEKGRATDGGAISASSVGLTISNCIIRDNIVTSRGGGIFVSGTAFSVPTITNTFIVNNVSTGTYGGGGLYFANSTATSVTNCIITNNSSTGTGNNAGGGGVYLGTSGHVVFYNCVVASNNAAGIGDNIFYRSNKNPQFFNTIVWDADDPIGYYSSLLPADPTNFNYCAIQNYSSGYNECIFLNANNIDPAGPNFTNPVAGDYSLTFLSNCINRGTASGAPALDILGNPRVGATDIGAYEFVDAKWRLDAVNENWDDAANWEGLDKASAHRILIPYGAAHYPNPASTSSGTTFTLQSGQILEIEPGAQVTFNLLTNNGTVLLRSNADRMFSLMLGSYSGTGTVQSEVFLTGGSAGGNKWHYIAVPGDMDKGVLTSINSNNLLRYDDSAIPSTGGLKTDGWQWHDGYLGTSGFSTLEPGRGYNFYHSNSSGTIATFESTTLLTDLGYFPLQYSGDYPDDNLYGWNLMGNSLTCSVDWSYGFANCRVAIYFTINDEVAAWVDGDEINGGTSIIPPLQGYFVKADADNNDFDLTGAQVHSSQSYFKGNESSGRPKIRLTVEQGNDKDETLIRFYHEATTEFDDKLDASKWISGRKKAQLYTYSEKDEFCINTIPLPPIKAEIPLAVKISAEGNYSIKMTQIEGIDDYNVFLTDLTENKTTNMRDQAEYNFTASEGLLTGRFVVVVENIASGSEEVTKPDGSFNIYGNKGMLNIIPVSEEWNGSRGSVTITDLTGKSLVEKHNLEFWQNSLIQMPLNRAKGFYLVTISAGSKRFTGKVMMR